MDPRDGLPAVKITCPYTTQNCPLFAPSFSLESVQPVSHLPQVRKDADDGQQREHQEPTEQRHEQDQGQQHQFTALPPIRTRAEHPEARSSGATTTQQTSPAQQLSLPSLRLPSLDYSDYSLAPSPAPSASTSSSALARPSEFYTSQPRQLPPYFPHRYSPPPVEQQRPQAGSATTTSLHRGFQWGESGGPSRGGEAREGAAEGEESTGIYGSRGGRRYSLLHLGGATSPAAEEGARAEGRPSSAMREEQEQGQHGGQGSSGGEGYYAEGQGAGHPAPSGNGSASMAASPSLSGEDEVAEGPQSEMITPFISKLVHLLSHRDFREVIRWTDAGDAFVFAHTSPVLLDVFVHSFVRQLNIYDFQRLSTLALLEAIQTTSLPAGTASISASDYSAFTHPLFWRDGALNRPNCDLSKIKPKATKGKTTGSKRTSGGAKRKTLGTNGEKAGGVRSRVNV